jgi:hypothetical protein
MASQPRSFMLRAVPAAVLAVAALALAGCGGTSSPAASATSAPATSASAASPAATVSAATAGKPSQAPPAGYQWVGIGPQNLWLAVPDSWVVLNLSNMSVTQAMERVRLKGQPAAAMRKDLEGLKQNHGIVVMDLASAATSPVKFASNVNAFCTSAAMEPGTGAASALQSGLKAEYAKVGAHVLAVKKITVSDSAVIVRLRIQLQSTAGYTVDELQYADLTNQGRICYTTFSTDRPGTFFPVFEKVAGTLHVG